MQELSFDTFKSIKSQEIVLPPSNTMILPHDYVNYTRVMWSDGAGIKHPLYPTRDTQNPFKILQEDNGDYNFTLPPNGLISNGDFSKDIDPLDNWTKPPNHGSSHGDTQLIVGGQYEFYHNSQALNGIYTSRHYAAFQQINVSDMDTLTLSAKGQSSAIGTNKDIGIIRVGISTALTPDTSTASGFLQTWNTQTGISGYDPTKSNPNNNNSTLNMTDDIYNLETLNGERSVITFNAGDDTLSAATELVDIDVSGIDIAWVLITSSGEQHTAWGPNHTPAGPTAVGTNAIDDIIVTGELNSSYLQSDGDSTTWSNYKSNTPSENQDSYDDDYYVNALGQRYGLNPQHAQTNGSFYIDNLRGLINFSSNVSGKTVILDYISDSLGTDGEMQVHKFAEEAMYKWIMYAILSTRANTPEYIVRRYQKEKFAATRQAKLRLSNIKLEELTQTLRGKSKHIKH